MGSARVTASDVAKAAGVSQPTVSRVFNRSTAVDPVKAARVRAVAKELGYIPNLVARSLNSGSSFRIGIVLAYLKNGFFVEALQAFSKALNSHGYSVTVYFAGNQSDEVNAIVDDLLADRVDGIVLASISLSNTLVDRVRKSGIPCVLFNRGQSDPDVSMVTAAKARSFNHGSIEQYARPLCFAFAHELQAAPSIHKKKSTGTPLMGGIESIIRRTN